MSLHPVLDELLELRHQARALGLRSHHPVNSALAGLYASVFRGQGLDFDEVREYREGDDIRNMDWKITARTNSPHLKIYREERERTVMLCVERSPYMDFGTRGTFKSIQAARAAALLGWSASQHQDRVGGLLFGEGESGLTHFRPGRGRRSLWRLLRALTEPRVPSGEEADSVRNLMGRLAMVTPTGSLIFIIGAFEESFEALEQGLSGLCRSHDVVLIPVDDPADRELPSMGKMIFTAADGRELELDTGSEAGRERFRQQWEERREQLRQLTNRLGIVMIPLETRQDVHRALLDGLRLQAKRRAWR
ncbi:MAG: DUF58 domain-containing protein [Chromatiales bacterium]|nr:DUF58 domain-containing protein [Chromatiales bacterium]